MKQAALIPIPGALRWRALHLLIDGDGSCSLIYDLERAAVLEVPPDLQLHLAPALEMGNPDDELLSWLVREDLLTSESRAVWNSEGEWAHPRCDAEVHAQLAPGSVEEACETLAPVFRQGFGAARVQLFFDWGGGCPGPALLERLAAEADRLAARAHREVSCELVLDVARLTPAVASFLAASPFHVRVRCGAFPARGAAPAVLRDWQVETSRLFLLLDTADRLIVQCSLAGGARLLDLWSWAKRMGLRHLDALRLEGGTEVDPAAGPVRAREYRDDLLAIGEEIASDLGARRPPLDFRPLTRLVRRLLGSERLSPDGAAGWGAVAEASPCRPCWARRLCSHSALFAAPVDDPRGPAAERCALWQAEAEAALRLYHHLAQCDPPAVQRLLGDSPRGPFDPLVWRDDFADPRQVF